MINSIKFKRILFLLSFLSCTSVFAQHKTIDSLMNNLDYAGAVKCINTNSYNDTYSLIQKAEAWKNLGRMNQSLALLNEILLSDSTNIQVYNEIASCYSLTGNDKLVLLTYQKALRLNPNNKSLFIKIAQTQFLIGEYAQTIQTCKTILKEDSIGYVTRLMAKCYTNLEKPEAAIEIYENLIDKDSLDYRSVVDLADLYMKQDSVKKAIVCTDAFIRNDSSNIEVNRSNALSYFSNSDFKKALTKYQNLFALGDSTAMNYYYLGVCYFKEKVPSKAYDYLARAKEKTKSKKPTVLYFYALAAFDIYFCDEGIDALQKAIEIMQPDSTTMHNLYTCLADGYLSKNESTKAIETLKLALDYKINRYQILYKIAYAYDLKDDYRNALTYYLNFLRSTEGADAIASIQTLRKNANFRISILDEKLRYSIPK